MVFEVLGFGFTVNQFRLLVALDFFFVFFCVFFLFSGCLFDITMLLPFLQKQFWGFTWGSDFACLVAWIKLFFRRFNLCCGPFAYICLFFFSFLLIQ